MYILKVQEIYKVLTLRLKASDLKSILIFCAALCLLMALSSISQAAILGSGLLKTAQDSAYLKFSGKQSAVENKGHNDATQLTWLN